MSAIPLQYAPAEQFPPPDGAAFTKHAVAEIFTGDLVMLGVVIYRVKMKWKDSQSPRWIMLLWPVTGGLIIRESRFPREWLPSVVFDTEGDTKPLTPVG